MISNSQIAALMLFFTMYSGYMYYISPNLKSASLYQDDRLTQSLFEKWMLKYNKIYTNEATLSLKYETFKENYKKIQEINAKQSSYVLALNQFADLTSEEFAALHTGYQPLSDKRGKVSHSHYFNHHHSIKDLPKTVNWTAEGAVTPVKNQGMCGSCWAFSSTGALEGLNYITNGKLQSYSEQQLVSCSSSYGNYGCSGGLMDFAFEYVQANGIELENTYPYTGTDSNCTYEKSDVAFTSKDYVNVPADNVTALMEAVMMQPVSVAVEADQAAWQFYSHGIVTSDCGQRLDHGVLAVGFGTMNKTNYWLIKNSWGAEWGMNGYIMIERSEANLCGVLSNASYPIM